MAAGTWPTQARTLGGCGATAQHGGLAVPGTERGAQPGWESGGSCSRWVLSEEAGWQDGSPSPQAIRLQASPRAGGLRSWGPPASHLGATPWVPGVQATLWPPCRHPCGPDPGRAGPSLETSEGTRGPPGHAPAQVLPLSRVGHQCHGQQPLPCLGWGLRGRILGSPPSGPGPRGPGQGEGGKGGRSGRERPRDSARPQLPKVRSHGQSSPSATGCPGSPGRARREPGVPA